MSIFVWLPDQGVTRTPKPRVIKAKFGDGYEQRSSDRINNINESWSLSFTVRTMTEIQSIEAFLSGLAGVSSFDWTTPTGETHKFTCDTWSSSYNFDGNNSLNATFERVFEQ